MILINGQQSLFYSVRVSSSFGFLPFSGKVKSPGSKSGVGSFSFSIICARVRLPKSFFIHLYRDTTQRMSVTDTGSADIIMADFRESSGALANIRHSGISSSLMFLIEAADKVKTAESRVVMSSMVPVRNQTSKTILPSGKAAITVEITCSGLWVWRM